MILKRYSYLPGLLLVVAASVRSALDGAWDPVALGLVVAGALIVAGSVAWNRTEVLEWLRDPRGVFTVMTAISVFLLFVALVGVNILVWYNPWRADLTASGRNVVTAETTAILEELDTDVAFKVFGRSPDPQVDQLLGSFVAVTRRIRIESVDPDADAEQARLYGVVKLGTVIVTAGDKFRKVETPNEQSLIAAVVQATSGEARSVCFVAGHGERGIEDEGGEGLSAAVATLKAANYLVERVSLLEGEIPEKCAVAVLAGPRQALEPAEIERLGRYRPGRFAVLVDPAPAMSFVEWLRPFGIVPEEGIVLDTSGASRSVGGGPDMPIAFSYAEHPITRQFEIATMFRRARRLTVLERPEFGGQPRAIAQTSDRSFATAEKTSGDIRFDPDTDTRGPLPLAAATTISSHTRSETDELRLVVVGDSDFASNALLNRQGNRDFFLRIIAWLAGEREATIVSVQSRENRRTELTERTKAAMYLINLGVLPLIPFAAGVFAFLRSKR